MQQLNQFPIYFCLVLDAQCKIQYLATDIQMSYICHYTRVKKPKYAYVYI